MASVGSGRGGGLAKMASVLAGAALATGCQTLLGLTASAAPFSGGCFSFTDERSLNIQSADISGLQARARDCEKAGWDSRDVYQRAIAHYNSGLANARLGEFYKRNKLEEPEKLGLAQAATQLRRVVDNTQLESTAPNAVRKKKKTFGDGDLARAARLELGRVYRLQGDFAAAEKVLDETIKATPGDPKNGALTLEFARVVLERSGKAAFADGSMERAVGYLDFFSGKDVDPDTAQEGREALIQYATDWGVELMKTPLSRETGQRAIDAFAKAQAGVTAMGPSYPREKAASAYVRLGEANMRMGRLPVIEAPSYFNCSAEADPTYLNFARTSFRTALDISPNSAEANAAMGCALEALSAQDKNSTPQAAVEYYSRAAHSPVLVEENKLRYTLALARTLSASGRAEEAQSVFGEALSLAGDDRAQRAEIQVAIGEHELAKGDLAAASNRSKTALLDDPRSGAAHLLLGKALYAGLETRPQDTRAALSALKSAVDLTKRRTDQKALTAEALYIRSLIETKYESTGQNAILDARAAADLVDKQEYRDQACLAIVRHLTTASLADGAYRCEASESDDPIRDARAYLLEGMFRLKTTQISQLNKDKAWEYALQSFEKGQEKLNSSNTGALETVDRLRASLAYGEATAYACVGLRQRGNKVLAELEDKDQSDAKAYFTSYRVNLCQAR